MDYVGHLTWDKAVAECDNVMSTDGKCNGRETGIISVKIPVNA